MYLLSDQSTNWSGAVSVPQFNQLSKSGDWLQVCFSHQRRRLHHSKESLQNWIENLKN